jgi:hypothetical protein
MVFRVKTVPENWDDSNNSQQVPQPHYKTQHKDLKHAIEIRSTVDFVRSRRLELGVAGKIQDEMGSSRKGAS